MQDATPLIGNWSYPTRMVFGAGRISELPALCRELEITRPLLVTDPGLTALPMIDDITGRNAAAGIETPVFSDVRPNPVGRNVSAGVDVYRNGRHDGIIAVGGGSALDAAKAIALMTGQTRPIWDFEDIGDNWRRADAEAIAPVIAIPTTAGTGSEVGRASVILDESDQTKKIIFHPWMMPVVVLSDPELTVGLPAHITAATGMDALAHCLEAYCAPTYHPMAEGIAVEGIRLVKDWLPTAVADGSNLEARANMLVAASMGATAFQRGLGAIHSLSHPLGALYDTHHGLTNAVVMPYVLVHNRPAIETRIERLSAWLGLPQVSFDAFLTWVLTLRRDLSIPHTLQDLGVPNSDFRRVAEMAVVDPTAATNPTPLTVEDCSEMLTAAWQGTGV